jgi:hypothetical protein
MKQALDFAEAKSELKRILLIGRENKEYCFRRSKNEVLGARAHERVFFQKTDS